MKIKLSTRRIARRCGGLFLGVRLSFPSSLWESTVTCTQHWTESTLSIGLVLWQVTVDIGWGYSLNVSEDRFK